MGENMLAIVIVLNDLAYLDEILEVFVKFGVKGATILDSYGMAKALRKSTKLSYLVKGSIDRALPLEVEDSKTIFSVIPTKEADLIMKTITHVLNYSKSQTVGFMFSLPVGNVVPIK